MNPVDSCIDIRIRRRKGNDKCRWCPKMRTSVQQNIQVIMVVIWNLNMNIHNRWCNSRKINWFLSHFTSLTSKDYVPIAHLRFLFRQHRSKETPPFFFYSCVSASFKYFEFNSVRTFFLQDTIMTFLEHTFIYLFKFYESTNTRNDFISNPRTIRFTLGRNVVVVS